MIDLLATSTTLAKSRADYSVIRGYSAWMIVLVTCVHVACSATPLYYVVVAGLLRQPHEVVVALRIPLIIMIPWAGLIGWRRHLQGVMIRYGATKPIGFGTAIRVATIGGVGFGLYATTAMPGLMIVATALISAVAGEAAFVHWVSRRLLTEKFGSTRFSGETAQGLTWARLARFHLPLAVSTMVTLTTGPLIGVALALTPHPILADASWQVTLALLGTCRTITYALTEPTIALYRDSESLCQLRRFAVYVGLFATGSVVLAAVSGFDMWFFRFALRYSHEVAVDAHYGLLAASLTPVVNAMIMHLRGVLTAHHRTPARLASICVGISVLALTLAIGVVGKMPGYIVAGSALTASMLCEWLTLLWAWRRLPAAL